MIENDDQLAMYLLDQAHAVTVGGGAAGAPGYLRLSYAVSDDDITIVARTLRSRSTSGRLRVNPLMLFSGPRNFILPFNDGRPVVLGQDDHVLHSGPIETEIRVPLNLDGVWIVARRASLYEDRVVPYPAELIVIRVATQIGSDVTDLEQAIAGAMTAEHLSHLAEVPREGDPSRWDEWHGRA